MFDNIKEFFRTIFKSRLLVAATVMVLLFSVLIFRMFQLQIIMGEEYQDNYTLKIVRERTLKQYQRKYFRPEWRSARLQ